MILAGDIGGTKTDLALFETLAAGPVLERRYRNREQASLSAMMRGFLQEASPHITEACLAVAGTVRNGRCAMPNLPWTVDSLALQAELGLKKVTLINDLEATAHGIAGLSADEFEVLHEGITDPAGNVALIAAGTGLGEAILFHDGRGHSVSATEGGHADFAAQNEEEWGLCRFLAAKYGHVSYERVVAGPALADIYDYFLSLGHWPETPEFTARLNQAPDRSAAITEAALARDSKAAQAALELFVSVYGAEAGNLALKTLATGGVYLGGGIAPKILPQLRQGGFHRAFCDKGRFSDFMGELSVRVILNEKTALRGAAAYLLR